MEPGRRDTVERESQRIEAAYARRAGGDKYSWFSPGQMYMVQRIEEAVLSALRSEGLDTLAGRRIADIGCGSGFWLRRFLDWGADAAQVTGIELLPDRAREAVARCPPAVTIHCGNAIEAPLGNGTFDLVTQFTVFTSILDASVRRALAARMRALVRPGGMLVWYDYFLPSPGNPDVRQVGRREIEQLFPECAIRLRRTTLLPPLARSIAPYTVTGCRLLESIPLLRSHYLGIIRPNEGTPRA